MQPIHFEGLERVEFDACADLYRAAPESVRLAHAITVQTIGRVTCMTSRGIEPAAMFRRAVGVGIGHATSEAELDAALACMHGTGLRHAVPLAPESQPPGLASWLEQRGYTRGYAWMKFSRPCTDPPAAPSTHLDVRVVGPERAMAFAGVVVEGFGLPPTTSPWIAALVGRPNWTCVMALAEGSTVAAGAVYVGGEHAWLGLGATVAAHRRHGAQGALLALRIREAAARGARIAVTETGERLPDRPSASYRNILRAGFEEMYLRQNYMSAAA